MTNPVFSICPKSNGVPATFARSAAISIIVEVPSPILGGAPDANMMRVRQQELCLTSASFHCIWLFI
jgi:hypothetical protein